MIAADSSQTAVIASPESRLFIEAPAGYGKTTTMVERLVSDFDKGIIPYPKRVLALTFSVNAARKMKNDIDKELAGQANTGHLVKRSVERINVYNYHSLSRRILSLYGRPVLGLPADVNDCVPLNESRVLSSFNDRKLALSSEENECLIKFAAAVRSCNVREIERQLGPYCDLVARRLVPNGCITYNGFLTLAIRLLSEHAEIRSMYQNLYPYIMVDEAQDMNLLSYRLLKFLMSDNTRIYMFGDSLQRIYGFIGAIPNFVATASNDLRLKRVELKVNHRFSAKSTMAVLDRNIRENIRNPSSPAVAECAKVPMFFQRSIEGELKKTCDIVSTIRGAEPEATIAILVHSRGKFSRALPSTMRNHKIDCFNALFDDDSPEYISFNALCQYVLEGETGWSGELTLSVLERVVYQIKSEIDKRKYVFRSSYKMLLDALVCQVRTEMMTADPAMKYEYVSSVFECRALRHTMGYVPGNVFLSTMHSSKGLEWDYVIVPEMMQWVMPSSQVCRDCSITHNFNVMDKMRTKCNLVGTGLPAGYSDEQCVFYVTVTRARKNVIFLATTDRVNSGGEHKRGAISCMLLRPGIELAHVHDLSDLLV